MDLHRKCFAVIISRFMPQKQVLYAPFLIRIRIVRIIVITVLEVVSILSFNNCVAMLSFRYQLWEEIKKKK